MLLIHFTLLMTLKSNLLFTTESTIISLYALLTGNLLPIICIPFYPSAGFFYALSPTLAAESCEAAPGQGNHQQADRRSYLAILSLTVPADRASGSTFCWHISLCARHLQSAGRWFQTRFCPAAAPGQQDAAKRQTQGR